MKTMAIRLEDDVHAQLQVMAQLDATTVADEIRQAIESHLAHKRAEGGLAERAAQALEELERESSSRRDAIQALFGTSETVPGAKDEPKASRGRGRPQTEPEATP